MEAMRTPVRAAVLVKPGAPLEIHELFIDQPMPGEVRVRTIAAGLCHSDLHYLDGTLPIECPAVLGHEVVGEIIDVGDEQSQHRIGERVIITITPSCGQCVRCVAGISTQCERSDKVRHRSRSKLTTVSGAPVNLLGSIGGFAEQLVVPESAAITIDPVIPASEACLLGCCVATGFGAVVHAAKVSPHDSVAVVGCGGVGIAAIQAARIAGARAVVAIDIHQEKLDRAISFGATHTLLSTPELKDKLHGICPGGVDKSFEAVGSAKTAGQAFELLTNNGTATILGLEPPGSRISIDAQLLVEGDRKLRGAYMGMNQLPRDILAFVAHYRSGDLDLKRMITSRWSFEEINDGFTAMQNPEAIRSVVEW